MANENIVAGLFGMTPDMYQRQQYQQDLQQGYDLARLDPGAAARAQLGAGIGQLGRGFAGAMGIEDPQLKLISARQQVLGQVDQSDPTSLLNGAKILAQMGDQQGAMALAQYARQAQSEMALIQQRRAAEQSSLATAAKTQLSVRQEEELRSELSKLGPDATQDQVIGVLTKYGPPEKVLAALTAAQSKTEATLAKTAASDAANQAKIEAAKTAADAKVEAARLAGATAKEIAQIRADTSKEIAQLVGALKTPPAPTLTTIVNPQNPNETITVDARVYKGGGKGAEGVIGTGKPSATQEKASLLKAQMGKDIDFAINELTNVTKEGGLIDQSTGSGAGRLADIGAGFFGQATEGAIAIGKLKPIQDLVLKMIPRFEGPQSDKDTQSYKEAAGQLADPTLPTKIRKEAGKTVLRLMQSRKNQFVSPELASEGIATTQPSVGTGTAQNPIVLK